MKSARFALRVYLKVRSPSTVTYAIGRCAARVTPTSTLTLSRMSSTESSTAVATRALPGLALFPVLRASVAQREDLSANPVSPNKASSKRKTHNLPHLPLFLAYSVIILKIGYSNLKIITTKYYHVMYAAKKY